MIDRMYEVVSSCINKEIAALEQVFETLSTNKEFYSLIDQFTKSINESYGTRILVTGVGKNSNIASKIAETMASLGIPSFYLNTSHLAHGDYGFIGPNDKIIHISRSGTTAEMVDAIGYIKMIRPNVDQILFHCNQDLKPINGLTKAIFVGQVKEADVHGLAPTSSTTALLCALDAFSVAISDIIGFGRMDFLKFHPGGALGKMLKAEQK